jgi:hypothetical protein
VRGEFGASKVFIARAFRFNAGLDWPGHYGMVWTMEIVCPRACRPLINYQQKLGRLLEGKSTGFAR